MCVMCATSVVSADLASIHRPAKPILTCGQLDVRGSLKLDDPLPERSNLLPRFGIYFLEGLNLGRKGADHGLFLDQLQQQCQDAVW